MNLPQLSPRPSVLSPLFTLLFTQVSRRSLIVSVLQIAQVTTVKRSIPMAWQIDAAHSEIQFSARHMMISTVRGQFKNFIGTVEADEQNPTAAQVDVRIEATSLVTGDEKRDG